MAEHTPGPWEAHHNTGAGWEIIVPIGPQNFVEGTTGNNVVMFEVWIQFPTKEWREQVEANARLIAAAPDLLEAAKLALEALRMPASIQALKAAIAKATETP